MAGFFNFKYMTMHPESSASPDYPVFKCATMPMTSSLDYKKNQSQVYDDDGDDFVGIITPPTQD